VEQRIKQAVDKFAAGLANEIVAVIYEDLIEDLQTQRATNKNIVPTNGKRNGKTTRRNGKSTRKNAKKVSAKNGNAAKRTPAQLERIATRALANITKKPGQGIEAIAKTLKLDTKELSVPVRKLIADKAVRSKGDRRATTYFPKGKGRKTAAKKTATKSK